MPKKHAGRKRQANVPIINVFKNMFEISVALEITEPNTSQSIEIPHLVSSLFAAFLKG